MNYSSIVDLLDAFFGGTWTSDSVSNLSSDEVDALATDIDSFYSDFRVPEREDDKIRTYSGGATFAVNARATEQPIAVPDSQLLPFAHAATLYVDEIVIDCPLDAWVFSDRDFLKPQPYSGHSGLRIQPLALMDPYGVGFKHAEEDEQRAQFQHALHRIEVLEPAIRAGWVIPVPHLRMWKRRAQTIATQVRHDVLNLSLLETLQRNYSLPPAQSDHVRGRMVLPGGGVIPKDHARAIVESPMLYFDSVLAVADSTDARFLPTADADYALLLQRIADAGKASRSIRDGLVIGGIGEVLLPSLEEFAFDTVCEIRRSEAAFAEWRDCVRNLANGHLGLNLDSLEQQQQIVTDKVDEYVTGVRAVAARSRTLNGRWKTLRPDGVEMAFAAALWAAPPVTSLPKLLTAVAAPLLKRAVLSAVSPTGANNSIVAKLDRARQR